MLTLDDVHVLGLVMSESKTVDFVYDIGMVSPPVQGTSIYIYIYNTHFDNCKSISQWVVIIVTRSFTDMTSWFRGEIKSF